MTETNVPRLRFKEFQEGWNEKELRKISDSFSGGTPNVNDKENYGGEIPFIRSSDINNDVLNLHLTNKGVETSSAKLVKKGTLLVALYGATSGKTGIAKADGAINQAVLAILPKEDFDKLYIYDLLNYKKNKIVNKYIQGGQGNLSGKIINNLKYFYPDYVEQQKIGSFFSKIDKLIELQTQKLEQLKKLKRGYLQKMFPQNGESVPRLRFSGFSGDWKENKIFDIATIKAGGDADKTRILSFGRYPVIANNIKNEGIIGYYNDYYNVDFPCVTVTARGTLGIPKARNYKFASVGRLLVVKSILDINFLENLIKTIRIYNESTGVPQLTGPQFGKYSIFYTKNKVEQQKIGSFFSKLDQLINFETDKIELLKQRKKAYLQKMFI